MAASVYQTICDAETLVEPLDLYKVSLGALVGVPIHALSPIRCKIVGNPMPCASPSYKSYNGIS